MPACSRFHAELDRFYHDSANSKFVDVIVMAEGVGCKCHRIVLASRSKFFDQCFNDEPLQLVDSPVDLEMTKVLLHFMYSSSLPTINAQNVHALLRASELLNIIEVSNHCYEYLRRNVGQLPIRHFKSFSIWYNQDPLHVNILRYFILSHFEICLRTDDSFLQLPARHLKHILTHYRLRGIPYENENFLVVALIRWARADVLRKRDFEELLGGVDFDGHVSLKWLHSLRTEYANDWDFERQGWKAMIIKCLPLFVLDANRDVVTAPAPAPAPLIPRATPSQPSNLRLLVGHHAELSNPCQSQHNAFETYEIFSRVEGTWHSSYKFERTSRISWKCTPALMASIVLHDPSRLYCLEYDTRNVWPQFNAYDFLGDLSSTHGRKELAKAPYPFSHRPSMVGIRNRLDSIYLYGNDELVGSSRYELAQCFCPEFDDERAYKQCCFYYMPDRDKWSVVPFRGNELRSSCLVVDNTLTYLIGGYQDAQVGGSLGCDAGRCVQAYDHRQSSWTTLPMTTHSYHSSRYRNSPYATGCFMNGEIFVSDLTHMEIYNLAAGRWREVPEASSRLLVKPDAWRKFMVVEELKLLYRHYQANSNIVCEVFDVAHGLWRVLQYNLDMLGESYVNDLFIY